MLEKECGKIGEEPCFLCVVEKEDDRRAMGIPDQIQFFWKVGDRRVFYPLQFVQLAQESARSGALNMRAHEIRQVYNHIHRAVMAEQNREIVAHYESLITDLEEQLRGNPGLQKELLASAIKRLREQQKLTEQGAFDFDPDGIFRRKS